MQNKEWKKVVDNITKPFTEKLEEIRRKKVK